MSHVPYSFATCISPGETHICALLQGGAISYAAAVATAYGIRACVVTAAGKDADLSLFRGHDLHVVPAQASLTFEHSYTWWGNKRKLRVTAHPNVTLTMADVPKRCRRARTVLLGPLTPADLDAASFVEYQQGAPRIWLCLNLLAISLGPL